MKIAILRTHWIEYFILTWLLIFAVVIPEKVNAYTGEAPCYAFVSDPEFQSWKGSHTTPPGWAMVPQEDESVYIYYAYSDWEFGDGWANGHAVGLDAYYPTLGWKLTYDEGISRFIWSGTDTEWLTYCVSGFTYSPSGPTQSQNSFLPTASSSALARDITGNYGYLAFFGIAGFLAMMLAVKFVMFLYNKIRRHFENNGDDVQIV